MTPVEIATRALQHKKSPEPVLKDSDFVSSGLTLLNLACYNRTDRGLAKGRVYRLAGRTGAAKTFVCRTILAEAARNPAFKDYELIYDDVEEGALMDTSKFFGQQLVNRLVPPAWAKAKEGEPKKPIYSRYTIDFYTRLRKKLDAGKKVIWIEDSLDALDMEKMGKMSDGKAKMHSQYMRKLMGPLADTGSILGIVCQARVKMNSMFDEDISAGGRALEHYPSLEIWLRRTKHIERAHKGKKYRVGSIIRCHIKKNRISGQDKVIYFPFFPSYGIDDIGANINWLLEVKHWGAPKEDKAEVIEEDYDDSEKEKKIVEAPEFDYEGPKDKLVQHIEAEGLQRELQILTGRVWKEVEDALTVKRKPRYD